MWFPLLVMALAVSLEPFRVGMTLVMVNRPRPALQLLAFLAGGFAMGTAVGVAVLFVLRPALGSPHFTLPRVQLAVGALILVNAVLIATGVLGRPGTGGTAGLPARVLSPLVSRARDLLGGRSLWTATVAGLGIALPSIDYLAALALIVASGAAVMTQLGALVAFNVVAFALVEIPLLCYLVAPGPTRDAVGAVHAWLRVRGRLGVAALLGVVGAVLLTAGAVGL
jgi:hypothetical protein